MKRALALLICLPILAACQTGSEGGVLARPGIGLAGIHSHQALLTDEVHHVLMGHVVIATDRGRTGRALVVTQRRDGVHALGVTRAVARDGTDLSWQRLPYPHDSCGPMDCRDRVLGMIPLSEAGLARATRDGLTARLATSVGPIPITAPPDLFQHALELAATQDI